VGKTSGVHISLFVVISLNIYNNYWALRWICINSVNSVNRSHYLTILNRFRCCHFFLYFT